MMTDAPLMDILTQQETQAIEQFCLQEVTRQMDLGDPFAVSNLFDAWHYSVQHYEMLLSGYDKPPLSTSFIKTLGMMAKPEANANGWRTVPIRIGWTTRDNQYLIPEQISGIVAAYNDGRLNAQELYLEYEFIHPFRDGNGRTGKILFNWANGTLRNPQMPENPYGWSIP
jgi:hypothetical protein